MEKNYKISKIIAEYVSGLTTPEQEQELIDWISEKDEHKKILTSILKADNSKRLNVEPDWNDLQQKLNKQHHYKYNWSGALLKIAAMFTITILTYLYADYYIAQQAPPTIVKQKEEIKELPLGVTLSTEGKLIDLEQNQKDLQLKSIKAKVTQGKLKIEKSKAEVLVPTENKLIVPRGSVFQIELPDKSKVWVNSETTLIFPSFFSDDRRVVKVEGEAYFEVETEANRPFYVETAKALVRVTGTRFNVSAYNSDRHTEVTLAEGKVDVKLEKDWHKLAPGKQIRYENKTGVIGVNQVNVNSLLAWINGIFEFEDMPIDELVNRLERWYDVEFVFENEDIKKQRFTGAVKKDVKLEYLLKMIAQTTKMNYSIAQKHVTIK